MMGSFTWRSAVRTAIGWSPEDRITSETAWLNGMRGLAAFLVLMTHYSLDYLTFVSEAPFGALMLTDSIMNMATPFGKGSRLWTWWRLPIVHNLFSNGGGQVALFFVISGFVLTWTSLGLAQSANYEKLYTSLSSSSFRRWSRLFLPSIAVTYIYALKQDITDGRNVLLGTWSYLGEAASWTNPFRSLKGDLLPPLQLHNGVVWTIPYEFSGSIFVFVLVLLLGRFPFSRRLPITILLTTVAFFSLQWHLWLFGAGMALADYARHFQLLKRDQRRSVSRLQPLLWLLCLLFGWILLGWPLPLPEIYTRPGYDWGDDFPLPQGWRESVATERFFWGTGAIMMVASACHLRFIRRFYETALLQYLGKISFMLYLIHIFIGEQIGRKILRNAYEALCTYVTDEIPGFTTCSINPLLHFALLFCAYATNVLFVLVAANLLERFVDRPITRLGKTVDDLLLRKAHPHNVVPLATMEQEAERLLDSATLDELEMGGMESKKLDDSETSSEAESIQHHRGLA